MKNNTALLVTNLCSRPFLLQNHDEVSLSLPLSLSHTGYFFLILLYTIRFCILSLFSAHLFQLPEHSFGSGISMFNISPQCPRLCSSVVISILQKVMFYFVNESLFNLHLCIYSFFRVHYRLRMNLFQLKVIADIYHHYKQKITLYALLTAIF